MKIVDYSNQDFTNQAENRRFKLTETLTATLAFIIPALFLFVISAK